MARDRQRAKQRKQRQSPQPPSRDRDRDRAADEGNGGIAPEPDALHRENVPGAWEHGGEVDQFEAELVAGADGEPADDLDAAERAAIGEIDPGSHTSDESDGTDATAADVYAATGGGGDGGAVALTKTGGGDDGERAAPVARHSEHAPAAGKGGSRFANFLRACWAELQRVQWPDRRQVGQATAVVLGFVLVAGAFLGFADFVANEIVQLIL